MKSCKSKQARRRRDGTKREGKIWWFLNVYLLRHKCLGLFRYRTFRYLNQIQRAAVHQRTTRYVQDSLSSPPEGQRWKIRGFFWKQCTRSYHARDLFSLGEMLICRLGTNASFLNLQHVNWTGRQDLTRYALSASLTYFRILSLYYYWNYFIC